MNARKLPKFTATWWSVILVYCFLLLVLFLLYFISLISEQINWFSVVMRPELLDSRLNEQMGKLHVKIYAVFVNLLVEIILVFIWYFCCLMHLSMFFFFFFFFVGVGGFTPGNYTLCKAIHVQRSFRKIACALNKFWLVESWFLDTRSSSSRYVT